MKERIIEYLKSEQGKKTNIEELNEVLHISSSKEFKEMIKSLNQLLDEAVVIENNKHEITLIENTNF